MSKNNTKPGCGVVVPTITIFNEDESIDYGGMKTYLNFLLENGAGALFSLGTTQENATFTEEEYKKLVAFIIEEVDGKVPVYIGVSSPATHISKSYAKYAESVGADAVFAGGPYYMKVTEDELMQFHRDISESVDIPYLLYNNPGLAKLGLPVTKIANLTKEGVVSMVKDTTGNPVRAQDLKVYCKEGTKVFFGDDYGAYQAMAVGVDGWTAGVANIIPKECVECWDSVVNEKDYDKGFEQWKRILPLLNVTINKEFYGHYGARPDWLQIYKEGAKIRLGTSNKVRKPLFEIPETDREMVKRLVEGFGY